MSGAHETNGTNGIDDETPLPLPQVKLAEISHGLALLEPLSRKGTGPGLIVLPHSSIPKDRRIEIEQGVPAPLIKWAEEGYAVVEVREEALQDPSKALGTVLDALKNCPTCDQADAIGIVVYDTALWNKVAPFLKDHAAIVGAVIYSDADSINKLIESPIPSVRHLAGKPSGTLPRTAQLTAYAYENVKSSLFATPFSSDFHYSQEAVSHTRSLTFLKPLMKGPYFDLEAIWEEHTYFEFADRSPARTMATMVQEPYVNHIPTLTGGIGRDRLTQFYQRHFIFKNPDSIQLELISRTTGIDRVIDEFIAVMTHDREVDWLIPGIPATGKRLEIPATSVVNIRGDRLYHEHIAWDQATVLRQLGLLPEYLPYNLPLPDGRKPGPGKRFEFRLPVAGIEGVHKMRDKNSVESNQMFEYGIREVDA